MSPTSEFEKDVAVITPYRKRYLEMTPKERQHELNAEKGASLKANKRVDLVAATLFGLGLAVPFLPIALASLIVTQNLFTECLDRMGQYWRSCGWH